MIPSTPGRFGNTRALAVRADSSPVPRVRTRGSTVLAVRARMIPMVSQAARRLAVGLVRAYQLLLSPWLGGRCRHVPSCSGYAIEAIERFGVLRGGWLTVKRLGRCHPWGTEGLDPVPPAPNTDNSGRKT